MKRLSMFFLLSSFFVQATALCQQVNIGVTGGVSMANIKLKSEGITISADNKTGFTLGLVADKAINQKFSFQPALNYIQKGYRSSIESENYKSKLTINYIEIPLNFLFRPAMKGIQLFAGAGPSVAFALSAKEKEEVNGNTTTYKYKFGNNPDEHDLRRMDFGANFIAGVETKKGLLLAVNYNLGLSTIAPGSSDNGTVKSRYFAIRVGYLLRNKK